MARCRMQLRSNIARSLSFLLRICIYLPHHALMRQHIPARHRARPALYLANSRQTPRLSPFDPRYCRMHLNKAAPCGPPAATTCLHIRSSLARASTMPIRCPITVTATAVYTQSREPLIPPLPFIANPYLRHLLCNNIRLVLGRPYLTHQACRGNLMKAHSVSKHRRQRMSGLCNR